MDPNPYQLGQANDNADGSNQGNQDFKVFIHTLAQYTTFGPGSYGMGALKRMTGTTSFKQLPDYQKNCLVHNREKCQTEKYLEQVRKECQCAPWALVSKQVEYETLPKAQRTLELSSADHVSFHQPQNPNFPQKCPHPLTKWPFCHFKLATF